MSKLRDNSLVQLVFGLLRTRRFPAPVPPPAPRKESQEQPSPAKRRGRPRDQLLPVPHEQRLQNNFHERHYRKATRLQGRQDLPWATALRSPPLKVRAKKATRCARRTPVIVL